MKKCATNASIKNIFQIKQNLFKLIIFIIFITIIKMEHTTIAIKKDLKEKIMEFATKKESYSDVIERLLESAKERQLNDILFNEKGFIPIEQAMAEARKKWPKSK